MTYRVLRDYPSQSKRLDLLLSSLLSTVYGVPKLQARRISHRYNAGLKDMPSGRAAILLFCTAYALLPLFTHEKSDEGSKIPPPPIKTASKKNSVNPTVKDMLNLTHPSTLFLFADYINIGVPDSTPGHRRPMLILNCYADVLQLLRIEARRLSITRCVRTVST